MRRSKYFTGSKYRTLAVQEIDRSAITLKAKLTFRQERSLSAITEAARNYKSRVQGNLRAASSEGPANEERIHNI